MFKISRRGVKNWAGNHLALFALRNSVVVFFHSAFTVEILGCVLVLHTSASISPFSGHKAGLYFLTLQLARHTVLEVVRICYTVLSTPLLCNLVFYWYWCPHILDVKENANFQMR